MTNAELDEARCYGELEIALRIMERVRRPQRQDIKRLVEDATQAVRKAYLAQSEICVTHLLDKP